MKLIIPPPSLFKTWVVTAGCLLLTVACSKAYYGAMEKVGIHKRDILVDRVENARDAQSRAQEQFKDALTQFESVVAVENSDLKEAYEKLDAEFKASDAAAKRVSSRISRVESVANDLFAEWEQELTLYSNQALRDDSARKLKETRQRYTQMLSSMHKAEKSMQPILGTFRDNVLFLKHNLNAQAIGSLRSEFAGLKAKVEDLIRSMNDAIASSNRFIEDLQ